MKLLNWLKKIFKRKTDKDDGDVPHPGGPHPKP